MAKPPIPAKPESAIDAAPPASTPPPVTPPVVATPAAPAPAAQPWATPETSAVGTPPATPSEPPAGTPLTPEERAANGLSPVENAGGAADEQVQPVEPALNAPPPTDVPPVEAKLTLGGDDAEANAGRVGEAEGFEPSGDDGRPDGFIPGDQTAAGALTPPGGQRPGAPKGLHPSQPVNLQDPYNVNGTARNQELLAMGHGIKNPLLDEGKAGPSDEDADSAVDRPDDK